MRLLMLSFDGIIGRAMVDVVAVNANAHGDSPVNLEILPGSKQILIPLI